MSASPHSEPSLTTSGEMARVAPAGLAPGMREVVAGRYRLLQKLAEGGMGSVFIAEHTLSQKRMALKVVHPYLCRGRQGVERFKREVSAAAQIDHPGIVQVFDAGVDDDGGFFMAMELLTGESIGDRLRREWPGMATAVRWIEQMLEPLAKAHEKGFVHRDLKPDNVFLSIDADGRERVKILDFGLAREVTKGGPTRTGITFGTPEYMSPEQAMSARKVRPPGDVWSVGVMLYELLSGEHPFTGETPNAIMANAIKEPHPPLADKAPHVPPELAAVVERALEKEPEHRPQTAGEFLVALRAVTGRVTLDETVPPAPVAPPRWDEESEEPLASSDFPVRPRQAEIATHVDTRAVDPLAISAPPKLAPNRLVLGAAIAGALALVGILTTAVVVLFGSGPSAGGDTVATSAPSAPGAPVEAVAEPVSAPVPSEPTEAAPSEEAPTGSGGGEPLAQAPTHPTEPSPALGGEPAGEGSEPEPSAANGNGRRGAAIPAPVVRPLATGELPPDPYAPVSPTAAGVPEDPYGPTPRARRRGAAAPAAAELPDDPYAATPLNTARECMARNDRACAIRALEGRARSAEELSMLVELYRASGQTPRALDTAQRYVQRHPRGRNAAEYRAFLQQYGR
ncbi:MAG: protein kinase [Sandaracinaceae bacterium]|nr:protein kinase [Sandaracinaceae bacterium]